MWPQRLSVLYVHMCVRAHTHTQSHVNDKHHKLTHPLRRAKQAQPQVPLHPHIFTHSNINRRNETGKSLFQNMYKRQAHGHISALKQVKNVADNQN